MGTTQKRGPTYVPKQRADRRAVVVERELKRLHAQHGTVNPQMLVDEARSLTSPLHRYFEWDDEVAAHKFRLAQAYQMIQASKFVVVLNKQREGQLLPEVVHACPEVRMLLPVFRGGGFGLRDAVLGRKDSRARFIEERRGVLLSWCRSVIDVPEFDEVRLRIEKWLG